MCKAQASRVGDLEIGHVAFLTHRNTNKLRTSTALGLTRRPMASQGKRDDGDSAEGGTLALDNSSDDTAVGDGGVTSNTVLVPPRQGRTNEGMK